MRQAFAQFLLARKVGGAVQGMEPGGWGCAGVEPGGWGCTGSVLFHRLQFRPSSSQPAKVGLASAHAAEAGMIVKLEYI